MSDPSARNWFDQGGAAYAQFRPEYPPELAKFLASMAPGRTLAVDVGCGTGQLTTQLADHFDRTLGLDPSADQLASATPHPRVEYRASPAERLQVESGSACLVTAAQAAHWFQLPLFFDEVRRIATRRAVVALLSYGVMALDDDLDARFQRFYRDEIGPFWPAQRRLVDSGYADIAFPFDERAGPPMEIRKDWTLDELLGYVGTWSATRGAREAGRLDVLHRFADDLAALWGPPAARREVRWPLSMRLGTV